MHLTSEVALDLVEGRLSSDQEVFWRQHQEFCTECTEEIRQWRQILAHLKRSHLKSASAETLESAIQIMPRRSEADKAGNRWVVASLIFDSFFEPALAGARGAVATARQLVMRAEEFDIHIKVWGDPEHRQMLGQLLPRGGTHFVETAKLHLLQRGERLETANVEETGEFHFTDLPEGELSLQVDLPHLTVIGALNFRETH